MGFSLHAGAKVIPAELPDPDGKPGDASKPVKVYILAGQSNMQGQGVVDFDHPEYYNGGRGILKNVMKKSEHIHLYKHIVDDRGDWVVRDDVFVRHQTGDELKTGGLTVGFTGYGGKHHIGPEFQLGHLVGEAYDEPVLLIKTAWGGKSIHKDFRPPSSGGVTGEFYQKMLAEYREGLANLGDEFPQLAKRKPELSGFVWFQGWNDMYNGFQDEYAVNMKNFIRDVRKDLAKPNLPFAIGIMGQNGFAPAKGNMAIVKAAQASMNDVPEFAGNVRAIPTDVYWDKRADAAFPTWRDNVAEWEKLGSDFPYHYLGSTITFTKIGRALGQAILELRGGKWIVRRLAKDGVIRLAKLHRACLTSTASGRVRAAWRGKFA